MPRTFTKKVTGKMCALNNSEPSALLTNLCDMPLNCHETVEIFIKHFVHQATAFTSLVQEKPCECAFVYVSVAMLNEGLRIFLN